MKILSRCMAFFFLTCAPVFAQAELPALKIGIETNYPPFCYLDEAGQPAGFDVDISLAVCQELRRQCELVPLEFEELLPGLATGRVEAVVASLGKTPEREELADFTDRYYRSLPIFIGLKGSEFPGNPDDLAGKTLTAQKGSVQLAYLQKNFGGVANIVAPDTVEESYQLVVGGQADFMLADSLTALAYLQSPEGRNLDFVSNPLVADEPLVSAHIAVRKGDLALRTQINNAIKSLKESGKYDQINRKYFIYSVY